MSRSRSYIPKTDWGKMYWFNNLVLYIGTDYEQYGLSQSQFEKLQELAARYQTALTTATMPISRTAPSIRGKNDARAAALAAFRPAAMIIKNNPAVTAFQRAMLSIHIDKKTKSPIQRPRTCPVLSLIGALHGGHVLRYTDSMTPSSRAKPKGTAHLELHVAVADHAVGDPAQARLVGNFTRQPILVESPGDMAGKVATYFGRWVTRTGKTGPWSPGKSLIIAYGERTSPAAPETTGNGTGESSTNTEFRGRVIRKAA